MAAIKGRGAVSGAASTRFNLPAREQDGDWLDSAETIDGPARHPATTVTEEHPRSILSFNASPDIPFDRSINAYRGCDQSRNGCADQEGCASRHLEFIWPPDRRLADPDKSEVFVMPERVKNTAAFHHFVRIALPDSAVYFRLTATYQKLIGFRTVIPIVE